MNIRDFDRQKAFVPLQSDVPLNIMLRWAGHQSTSSNDYYHDGMKRGGLEFAIWQYTISGCGIVECEEGVFQVPPGSAFLLTIPDKHRYYLSPEAGHWQFLYMGFGGDEAMRLAKELRRKHSPVSTVFASPAAVAAAEHFLLSGTENDITNPAELSAMSYRFFMEFASTKSNDTLQQNATIVQIHNFCLKHLAEPISIQDMANTAKLSRSHFCRFFRGKTGKAPHTYLMELRMRTALRMLQNDNASVKETAAACGFQDPSYFCKVFRAFFHDSPAHFFQLDNNATGISR